jgi:RNA polymerase sigma-32 factor
LNAPVRIDGEGEWIDWLADETESHEKTIGNAQEQTQREKMLGIAMASLNGREREIIIARRLNDPPATLEDLSSRFGVSRERVRQIEVRAFEKLQENIRKQAERTNLIEVK